jgi:D-arabinose 1-dehydrogenase-like Zn-dependent alcohol dehydrogenase
MKAWRFVAENAPLALSDVPEPTAGSGEAVVDVKAAGLCHTDVGIVDGSLSYILGSRPITLGHEVAGTVSALGRDVAGFAVGDRVAVRSSPRGPGIARDGGFQPRIAVQGELLVRVPDGVPWAQAAVSTDAGMTAYHAVIVKARVRAGDRVGIIGFGGLGSLGAQIARHADAEVYVAETRSSLHATIREAGMAVSTQIEEFKRLELNSIIDFAGVGTTTASAVATVGPGGRIVQVGHTTRYGTLDLIRLTLSEISLVGSLGGDKNDNIAVLELMAAGAIEASVETVSFDEVGEALRRLQSGAVAGRLVANYP